MTPMATLGREHARGEIIDHLRSKAQAMAAPMVGVTTQSSASSTTVLAGSASGALGDRTAEMNLGYQQMWATTWPN